MTSIKDLAKDETLRKLVFDVTTRFIENKKPTPRAHLYRKLAGRGTVIDDLIRGDFLEQPFTDKLVPGFMAFAVSGQEGLEHFAKNALDVVLGTLATLFERSLYEK